MSKRETIKRWMLFVISLFIIGMGVALTKHGDLGVSPISSIANVVSCKFTFLSFGTWLSISNSILVLIQILLLRKNFKWIQYMQFPMLFLFGYFTDIGGFFVRFLPNDTYTMQLVWVICGVIVHGLGISLGVIANVFLNAGEAFVKTISDYKQKDFGITKVLVDVFFVLTSVLLSLILFKGKLIGTREGTIISALTVGFAVNFFRWLLHKPLTKILKK